MTNKPEPAASLFQVHGWDWQNRTFTAGFRVEDGKCTESAPILRKFVLGKDMTVIRDLMEKKRWTLIQVR